MHKIVLFLMLVGAFMALLGWRGFVGFALGYFSCVVVALIDDATASR